MHALKKQQKAIWSKQVETGEVADDESTKAAYFAAAKATRKSTKIKLLSTARTAISNFSECEGYKKLEEAVKALEVRDRFDLSRKPAPLPDGNDAMFDHLGVTHSKKVRTTEYAIRLISGWGAVCQVWKAGIDTPVKVAAFWLGLRKTFPDLADLAMRCVCIVRYNVAC